MSEAKLIEEDVDILEDPVDSEIRNIINAELEDFEDDAPENEEAEELDEGEESEETDDKAEEEDAEEPDKADEESEPDQKTTGEKFSGKMPGIDTILKDLDETNPAYAAQFRSMQTAIRDTRTEFKAAMGELDTVLSEAKAQKERYAAVMGDDAEPGDEDEEILKNITADQWKLMEAVNRKTGVLTRAEVDAENAEKASTDFTRSEVDAGIENFGESFGHFNEEGKFVFDESNEAASKAVYKRIFDPQRGLTPFDFYWLGQGPAFAKAEFERGLAEGKGEKTKTVAKKKNDRQIKKSKGVVGRPRGGGGKGKMVYKSDKGRPSEPLEKTIARAGQLSAREHFPNLVE